MRVSLFRMLHGFQKVRFESYSKMLLELHSKRYTKLYLEREYQLQRHRAEVYGSANSDPEMFSTFNDKELYGGLVPTGDVSSCLRVIFSLAHSPIRGHL